MTGAVTYACGCRFMKEGPAVEVRPCSRHRQNEVVRRALAELVQALAEAHEDLPPLQIEQEERQASGGERWR